MNLGPGKTCIMPIVKFRKSENLLEVQSRPIVYEGLPIPVCDEYKYLGKMMTATTTPGGRNRIPDAGHFRYLKEKMLKI